MAKRHALNAPGDWYVDTHCIDCGAAAPVAPGLIVEGAGQSVFAGQPVSSGGSDHGLARAAALPYRLGSHRTPRRYAAGRLSGRDDEWHLPSRLHARIRLRRAFVRDQAKREQRHGGRRAGPARSSNSGLGRRRHSCSTHRDDVGDAPALCGAFRRAGVDSCGRSRRCAVRGPGSERTRAGCDRRRYRRDPGARPYRRQRRLSLR